MRLPLPLVSLLCAFSCCSAQVSQSPAALVTREGDRAAMACTYSSAYQNFQWYRQAPSGEITHLLTVAANRNATEGRFTGESREDGKKSFLHLSQTQMGDSGLYFCAVDAGSNTGKLIFGAGTEVSIEPDLPDSIPSVYKLESSKASISACLITDYYPDNIIITDRDGLNKSFQSSIVEVKDPGSNTKEASYGAVYWSQYDFQDDIKYGLNYKTRCRESAEDEEETCTTMEMSHDFETDEHLNLLSFTVLGMKVVFFKGVTCNLLVTFLAWKS